MSTEPTNYHPLEPTQPGYYNPYAYYRDLPPIPPPPPPNRKSHRGLLVALASIVGLLLIFGVVFGVVVVQANSQSALTPTVGTHTKPTLAPALAPTTTAAVQIEMATVPAVTPTLTTANSNYAADDIYNDMLGNNLPISSHYDDADFNLPNTAWRDVDIAWQPTSGILLNDASVGFSDSWPMGLYIFASKDQAYEDAQAVKANTSQVYVSTHGRCLLVADSRITDFSRYTAIVTQSCL